MGRKKKDTNIVDTEVYEVEKILESKINRGKLYYHVKWKGYPDSDNTDEPELRLNCDTKLIDYLVNQIDSNIYTKDVETYMKNLESYEKDDEILKIVDPLSSFAATTCLTGSVKFVNGDAVSCKFMLLEYIRDFNQTHLLHSAMLPSNSVIESSLDRYCKELQYRKEVFTDYPFIRIILPAHSDTVFYSPPPHANLLFEPVTEKIKESLTKHLFVPKSKDLGFNNVEAFVDKEYFTVQDASQDPRVFPFLNVDKNKRLVEGMNRIDHRGEPRFTATLELVQEPSRGWILRGGVDIESDTPLVLMTGVLRPSVTAHTSLTVAGEQVAFSSFIELPNSNLCLDRREFYDFSKFIPHSCTPTCSVRLVESGNNVPDLVVYNLVPLNEDNNREISLDYFQSFTKSVRQYFISHKSRDAKIFAMYNEKLDFVQCQCYSEKCRQVLYIDKSASAKDPTKMKRERLKNLVSGFFFSGMQVVESCKVWSINDGKFEE